MKLLRKFSRKKSMVDGPPAVINSSSTDSSAPYSPMSVVSNGHSEPISGAAAAPPPIRYPRSSSSGGSLPSPAMVTNEARQVLEVFLQRTQSMDRGSTGSISALVPRHLEVIQEIRHTRRKRSACTGDSSVGSMDALVVESSLPSNSRAHLDHMDVQHRTERDGHHVTDIQLHYHENDDGPGVDRVVCTHVRHPLGDEDATRGACAAKVVTEDSGEVFIDACMSRQASANDNANLDPSLTGLSPLSASDYRGPTPRSLPSSRAYDADVDRPTPSPALQQVAAEAAATGKAWKKRRKSFRSIARWFRNRNDKSAPTGSKSYPADIADTTAPSDEIAGFMEQYVGAGTWERPPFQSMESYSSSTSSTTSSFGAPSRSLVHRDMAAEERRRKRRKERHSFKWRQSGANVEGGSSSVFHQLFATLRYGRKRAVHSGVLTSSDPHLDEHRQTAALAKVKLSPSMEAAEDLEEDPEVHQSLPELRREQETQDVLNTFRCAIGAGGCKMHKKGQCPRNLGQDDMPDGARAQVDETKLHLDLNSSNSQSSQGGNTASSPDGLGPDGVAPQREVDRVARMLDEVAKSINVDLKSVGSRYHERRKSVPNMHGAPRSPSRERASSTNRRGQTTSASTSSTALSMSTPMLNEEAQQAMRAKARRMKSQSHEDLVSDDLVSQLVDCDTYAHFESLIRRSGLCNHSNIWKQITVLYTLTRKVIRVVRRQSDDPEERENAIKDFAMTFFSNHFASFVVKRGGWRNLIETTEDSELD